MARLDFAELESSGSKPVDPEPCRWQAQTAPAAHREAPQQQSARRQVPEQKQWGTMPQGRSQLRALLREEKKQDASIHQFESLRPPRRLTSTKGESDRGAN